MEDGEGAWFVANNDVLEKYRLSSIQAVAERLFDMYFMQKSRSLIKFEDVLRSLIKFRSLYLEAKGKD